MNGDAVVRLQLVVQAVFLPGEDQLFFEVVHCDIVVADFAVDQANLMIEAHNELIKVIGAPDLLEVLVPEDLVRLSVPLPALTVIF